MIPAWTVTVTYIGYAVALLLGAAAWLTALFDHLVYQQVELGLLGERWRDIAWVVDRQGEPAIALGLLCGVLAFLLALPAAFAAAETASLARSHRVYQMKSAAILLCLLGLVLLARGRMGSFDADLAAVAVFAWAAWIVASGWLAHAGGASITGPTGWWLALTTAGIAVAGTAILMVLIWHAGGIRVF